jgi:hypothetical protein
MYIERYKRRVALMQLLIPSINIEVQHCSP